MQELTALTPNPMEETRIEEPKLYDWLIRNGFELYYLDGSDRMMVRGNDFEDMVFELFAAITIQQAKKKAVKE